MTTSITGQGITAYKAPDDALSNESKNAVQNKVINGEVTDLQNAISAKAPVIINTASGNIATFNDGADGMQIRKIVGTIETAEGGSGWTGANITCKTGNIFDAFFAQWNNSSH